MPLFLFKSLFKGHLELKFKIMIVVVINIFEKWIYETTWRMLFISSLMAQFSLRRFKLNTRNMIFVPSKSSQPVSFLLQPCLI